MVPIVGGSILSHEHFQGGRYEFAMAKAPMERRLSFPDFPQVAAGIVKWPMSVLRLQSAEPEPLIALADRILAAWRGYTDEKAFLFAETDGEPHNAITPIARKRGELLELDLVLRNNITTEEFPLGVFHPHPELHHIKKENIGLIEVMGLAVLPSRLKTELAGLEQAIVKRRDIRTDVTLAKHADWVDGLKQQYVFTPATTRKILLRETGKVFRFHTLQGGQWMVPAYHHGLTVPNRQLQMVKPRQIDRFNQHGEIHHSLPQPLHRIRTVA